MQSLLARADTRQLLNALGRDGEEARIVGGAVRDAIMGRPPGDIDIATTVLPQAIMQVARNNGWKAVPTGLEHGTVTVVINRIPYEVTTLRRDVETDGRRAVVAFTRDFREDAYRRDFTINALSLSEDGEVHDYATGVADAAAGRVRFMGDPETRIREDYLRILRFFRFFASHGRGEPDAAGFAACQALAPGMAQLSRERVRQELLKLLAAPRAFEAAMTMERIGLWLSLLPGVMPMLADLKALIDFEASLGREADSILRLAAMAAERSQLKDWLKLSNQEAERILKAERFAKDIGSTGLTEPAMKTLAYRAGAAGFQDALMLAAARKRLTVEAVCKALVAAQPLLAKPPLNPFRSADLAKRGVAAGPRMGAILRTAEELWLADGLPDAPEVQAMLLTKAMEKHPD